MRIPLPPPCSLEATNGRDPRLVLFSLVRGIVDGAAAATATADVGASVGAVGSTGPIGLEAIVGIAHKMSIAIAMGHVGRGRGQGVRVGTVVVGSFVPVTVLGCLGDVPVAAVRAGLRFRPALAVLQTPCRAIRPAAGVVVLRMMVAAAAVRVAAAADASLVVQKRLEAIGWHRGMVCMYVCMYVCMCARCRRIICIK